MCWREINSAEEKGAYRPRLSHIFCDASTEIFEWKLENTENNIAIVYSKETMSDVSKKLHCQKMRTNFEFSSQTPPRNARETFDCEKHVEVLLGDLISSILCDHEAIDVTAENRESFSAGLSMSNYYRNVNGMDLNPDETDRNDDETDQNLNKTDQNPAKTDQNPDKMDQNLNKTDQNPAKTDQNPDKMDQNSDETDRNPDKIDQNHSKMDRNSDETDRNLPNSSPSTEENNPAFYDREGLISPPDIGVAENSLNVAKDCHSHEMDWSSQLEKTRYICNKEILYIVATSVTVTQAQRSRLEYLQLTAPWSTGRRLKKSTRGKTKNFRKNVFSIPALKLIFESTSKHRLFGANIHEELRMNVIKGTLKHSSSRNIIGSFQYEKIAPNPGISSEDFPVNDDNGNERGNCNADNEGRRICENYGQNSNGEKEDNMYENNVLADAVNSAVKDSIMDDDAVGNAVEENVLDDDAVEGSILDDDAVEGSILDDDAVEGSILDDDERRRLHDVFGLTSLDDVTHVVRHSYTSAAYTTRSNMVVVGSGGAVVAAIEQRASSDAFPEYDYALQR
ncbi:uncharacterized protein LOC125179575 [Hyalella azteca]|uniref:Uncharacterized protein LOC125179575 n=1 Tax=Hyalella azteca TaxID=294128 RepID=A0A979FXZ6_HYAAZ|nr:uncharacterized protein LOC125179575 [Hyalella azteca]